MILRELLAEYGMTTIREFARRAQLTRGHAWNLWHGRSRLGLNLARHIAAHSGIPLERLAVLEPTPYRSPREGQGDPRSNRLPPTQEEG